MLIIAFKWKYADSYLQNTLLFLGQHKGQHKHMDGLDWIGMYVYKQFVNSLKKYIGSHNQALNLMAVLTIACI